jgi:hypothetical protein
MNTAEIMRLNDPDFLAERRRVRETIETLQVRMEALDAEFIRRASLAWAEGGAQ